MYRFPEHSTDDTKSITKLESREVKNQDMATKKKRKNENKIDTAIKFLAIACVCVVLMGLIFIVIISSGKTKDVTVPNELVGLTEKDACKKIEDAKLKCEVKYVYDEEYEDDVVISVSPRSSSKAKEGNTVTIKVSSFADTILLEDYKGKKIDAVTAILKADGITVIQTPKKVTKEDKIEENTIISQSKEAGSRLQKNRGTIELVYATLISVYPDFTDGSYDRVKAQQFCDDNGIECIFKEKVDNSYNEGAIIDQSREAGEEVKSGAKITITIATNSSDPVGGEA